MPKSVNVHPDFFNFGEIYTVSQKNWATFLRPITLEILNRSLPNLAQIKVSSF